MKRYTKRKYVPENLVVKSFNKELKLKSDAQPKATFYSCLYKREYNLYDKNTDFVKKRKRKPVKYDTSKENISKALYIVNKYAKENPLLYDYKELTIEICKRINYVTLSEIHYSKIKNREYIIFSNYENEIDYYNDLEKSEDDQLGRPFLNKGIIYLIFEYNVIGNFGFHTPINKVKKVDNPNWKNIGEEFLSPRIISDVGMSLTKAKRILSYFIKQNSLK
ncbi:MAG: hypothetical protein ACOC56_02455 [Atribacterota bacterium]